MSLCSESSFTRHHLSLERQNGFRIQDSALSYEKCELTQFFMPAVIDVLYTGSSVYSFSPENDCDTVWKKFCTYSRIEGYIILYSVNVRFLNLFIDSRW